MWGYVVSSRPQGVIAAGMENGEPALWDPAKFLPVLGMLPRCAPAHLILRNTNHAGQVRASDLKPPQGLV
ncbi:hypothetical protein EDD18DRAFT_1195752, partial [Armillaria luteobubalina]